MTIAYPSPINPATYAPDIANPEVKYGLPKEVLFCKRCVISNQRPNSAVEYQHTKKTAKATIFFDENGVCDACRVADEKKTIQWDERDRELRELCDKYRRNDGRYDCVVPGSGGKDSFYASHILKYKYGMHPLTVTWAPHIYTDWGFKNFQSWIHSGFDNYLMTPNGRVHRVLTRLALDNILHPFQPFILGQKSVAPNLAAMFDIPLVFYGENEAEYGNPIVDSSKAERDWSYFTAEDQSKIFLSGTSMASLKEDYGLSDHDLLPYMPPNPQLMTEKKVAVHYLGYYLKWHPQSCYYYSVEHGGFQAAPERNVGTYSKYASIDDRMDDFNFYTMGVKFGIARATTDAAQEVRSGDITREEGVALVKRFDHEWPERFAEEIFRYFSLPEKDFPVASKMFEKPILDRAYFMQLADSFRSPHLWQHDGKAWSLRHAVWHNP